MKNQLLDLSFHIRHKNKKIREITNQTRKEVRNEKLPKTNHKVHLKALMSVINSLPENERVDYSKITSLVPEEASIPKDIAYASTRGNIHRANSMPTDCKSSITEIPYKKYIDYEGFLYKIYISDAKIANDLAELQKKHIFALLTFGQSNDPSKYTFLKGGYLCLPLEESSNDLIAIMEKVIKFIDVHLSNGNILIHCCNGNSRSCAALIGYFIKKYKISFDTAFNIIKEGRPSAKLAYLFERQLRRIERAELFN